MTFSIHGMIYGVVLILIAFGIVGLVILAVLSINKVFDSDHPVIGFLLILTYVIVVCGLVGGFALDIPQ